MDTLDHETLRINPDWAKLPLFDRTGWRRLPFSAFAESVNERVEPVNAANEIYVGLDDLDSGSLHIRRWGKGSDVIGTKLRFRKGDIIFGRRRAYQRKLAVAEMDGICSAHAMVVRAKPDVVLPEFLPFLMMSDLFMQRAVEISVGSLSPTINWKTLKLEEFDLQPLDQQRRIAELLWAANDSVNHCANLITECTKAYEATLESLSLRSAKHGIGTLQENTEFITDGDHNPPKRIANGIPHLVVKHVDGGNLVLDDCTYISAADFERVKKRYDPRQGDLVVTCVGTIGRVAIVPKDLIFSADRSLALIRPARNKLLPEFAKALLESEAVQTQMAAKAIGTAQKHLYLKDIRSIKVAIPNVEAQSSILSSLKPLRQSISSLTASRNAAKQLTYAIISSGCARHHV